MSMLRDKIALILPLAATSDMVTFKAGINWKTVHKQQITYIILNYIMLTHYTKITYIVA